MLNFQGSTGEPKVVIYDSMLYTNGGNRRMERNAATEESRFASVDMAVEEIAHMEEVVNGFYVGFELLVLPHDQTADFGVYSRKVLESLQAHRSVRGLHEDRMTV